MSHPTPDNSLPFNLDAVFRHGLGRTLFFYLSGVVMVPMICLASIGYVLFQDHVETDVGNTIALIVEIKQQQIQHLFDSEIALSQNQGRPPELNRIIDDIHQIINAPVNVGADYQIYVVGPDLNRLAGITATPHVDETMVVDTVLTRRWQENAASHEHLSPPPPLIFTGPTGHEMMGAYGSLRFHDSAYALIVDMETRKAFRTAELLKHLLIAVTVLTGFGLLMVSAVMVRMIVAPLQDVGANIDLASKGHFDRIVTVQANNEIGELAAGCGRIIRHLKDVHNESKLQRRIMGGLGRLHRLIGGEQDVRVLSASMLDFLAGFLDLYLIKVYTVDSARQLTCIGQFPEHVGSDTQPADRLADGRLNHLSLGRSIATFRKPPVGEVAPVPSIDQANLMVVPIVLKHQLLGFLELETTVAFSRFDRRFLGAAAELIAVVLNAALIRQQELSLQKQTRTQAKQLALREAALEASTRELKFQRQAVRESEKKLKIKQFELEAANAQMAKNAADLEAHMRILEKQKVDMQAQNSALEKAHRELADKARQLEVSSRYKTEFMANMSHELRTPLNSTLLLSRLLLENKEKTLTPKQQEFAKTIYSAGEDLLNLINEILDLAKVESGKMEVDLAPVDVRAMANAMRVGFAPLAEQKGISFVIHLAPDVPDRLFTDRKRIEQIVKNFLSNAFKFTAAGTIRLELAVTHEQVICRGAGHGSDDGCLSISVVDTGIGIPQTKHEMVFEAFQQVDGSTRRKHGGTGLGLSISRELAHLLGGEITLESEDRQGSRFTLHLPILPIPVQEPAIIRRNRFNRTPRRRQEKSLATEVSDESAGPGPIPDDRNRLAPGDASFLVIADDTSTGEIIKSHAYQHGFKVLIAEQPQTGLHFADYYLPSAIFVHHSATGGNNWQVVHQCKINPRTRHIPIFSLSSIGDGLMEAMYGAAGHITEPVERHHLDAVLERLEHMRTHTDRTVLAVGWGPDDTELIPIIGNRAIHIQSTVAVEQALAMRNTGCIDAMIVHSKLNASHQKKLITRNQSSPIPMMRYSTAPGNDAAPPAGNLKLRHITTADQLLLSLVGALHLTPEALDEKCRNRIQSLDGQRSVFKDRKVLLADDDMRTVFAVTSVLEDRSVQVVTGKTGKESLDKLSGIPDIDLILMDVMIAEVDGYQAIRDIRHGDHYTTTPIIALTAKAMQGDRAKCIDAGADDYLAKPVNLDKLISMLKIWFDPQLAGSSGGKGNMTIGKNNQLDRSETKNLG